MTATRSSWLPDDLDNTLAYNPLTAAAAPLFTIAYQLSQQTHAIHNPVSLNTTLVKEMKRYYEKAHQLGYNAKHILITRYWLCIIIDKFIEQLPNPNNLPRTSLLKQLNYSMGDSQFFVVLKEHQQSVKPSLDVLEIAYLCLSLGYTDEHVNQKDQLITDIRYQLIKQIQHLKTIKPTPMPKRKQMTATRLIILAVAIVTAVALVMLYNHFHVELTPIKQAYELVKNHSLTSLIKGFS